MVSDISSEGKGIRIPVQDRDPVKGKFRIEDSGRLIFGYFLRMSLFLLGPMFVVFFLLGTMFAMGGSCVDRAVLGLGMALSPIVMLFLPIFVPVILYFWFHVLGKSHITISEKAMEIYFRGYKSEWVKNRIELSNIMSVEPISPEALDDNRKRSRMYRWKILPRPKKLENGFYHIFSDPEKLVCIRFYAPVTAYNFYKHSLDAKQEGPLTVPRLERYDGALIADASDRYLGMRTKYGRDMGPAIRQFMYNEIFVDIKNKERQSFIDMLREAIRNNPPPLPREAPSYGNRPSSFSDSYSSKLPGW